MRGSRTLRQNRAWAGVGPEADPPLVSLEGVRPGGCTVALYDNTSGLLSFIARFVGDGVARGERCLCLASDSTPGTVIAALASHGVDVAHATERQALALVSTQVFGAADSFDAGRLIGYLRTWVTDTDFHRFAGVRIAAEMNWARRAPDTDKALMAFDALFDPGIGGKALIGAGIYRCGQFDPPALRRLIRGHRHVLAPDHICVRLCPMLQGLTEKARTALLRAAGERLVPKGRFFFRQGAEAAEVFVLMRGRVAFSRVDRDGQRVTSFDIAAPSDMFGYNSILADTPRSASAQALDDSRALVWDVALIGRTIAARPDIAAGVIEYLIRQRANLWHDLRILAIKRLEQRLAQVLWRLVEAAGRRTPHGAVIEVSLSGQNLAEMAATTPHTVSRIFATWRRQHIVDARRNHIRIVDAERLAAIARPDAQTEPSVR